MKLVLIFLQKGCFGCVVAWEVSALQGLAMSYRITNTYPSATAFVMKIYHSDVLVCCIPFWIICFDTAPPSVECVLQFCMLSGRLAPK